MVRVNIITGFLGAGKTSLIRQLLAQKPADERWAVLVNEFGDVGVDAALLNAGADIVVREVPGGCLCCANGLPFQIALNQLIGRVKPQRLLIEPTGLGHPGEILALLAQPDYAGRLSLHATLTLVDARKLSEPRYAEHAIFNQQLQVADHLLAAKADLCPDAVARLTAFARARGQCCPVSDLSPGGARLQWLAPPARPPAAAGQPVSEQELLLALPMVYNAQGYAFAERAADGFHSAGWQFHPRQVFDFAALETLATGLHCERLKAVMITDQGIAAFNQVDGVLSCIWLDECTESRFEIISTAPLAVQAMTAQLLSACKN